MTPHPSFLAGRLPGSDYLAVGVIRDGEGTLIDLRDHEGPVAEIMRAAEECEFAWAEFARYGTRALLDEWQDKRLELRKVASRVAHLQNDPDGDARQRVESRGAGSTEEVDAEKVAETSGSS